MPYSRFAIYYVPPAGALADFGAAWLGWDIVQGCEAEQFELPGLKGVTSTPRKYGFHGTIKPPFCLADGRSPEDLVCAASELAAKLTPAKCAGLELTALGRFLALVPFGDFSSIKQTAAACVRDLDGFRAAPSAEEITRRRKPHLTPQQEAMLMQWGYPHVMEEFRFHMTLTGRMPKSEIPTWSGLIQRHLPDLPSPFVMDQIALCGEREDGRFELIQRYTLRG